MAEEAVECNNSESSSDTYHDPQTRLLHARAWRYRTAPLPTPGLPPGIVFIVLNECAERFSFCEPWARRTLARKAPSRRAGHSRPPPLSRADGMKTILTVYMTKHLRTSAGAADFMGPAEAREAYHTFTMAAYLFPVVGALVSDCVLGKYATIFSFSLVYCAGHGALAVDETRAGLFAGLLLIAVGSGGIKPCVSAHVGDQFSAPNEHLLSRTFGAFYFAINLGSFASTLLTPLLLDKLGPHVAFGLPGLLMCVATLVFWLGRWRYAHIPPRGFRSVARTLRGEGLATLGRLSAVYAFIAVFWALYDQTGSAWVQQAERMDRRLFGVEWLPSQVQAINPVLVMLLIPAANGFPLPALCAGRCGRRFPGLYALFERCSGVRLTPLRKIGGGLFVTVGAFCVPVLIELMIEGGATPSIAWQLLAYVVLTTAEVMVSVTSLEFSYTQAPVEMKSLVMAFALAAVSLGNALDVLVNALIQREDGSSRLSELQYYLLFTVAMLLTALLFVPCARRYQGRTHLQSSTPQQQGQGASTPEHDSAASTTGTKDDGAASGGAELARRAACGAGAGGAVVAEDVSMKLA